MPTALPIPPPELAARIGGDYREYRSIGAGHRAFIESLLPCDWSFEGKAVLDFGCGTGRTLSAFAAEADRAEFVGCDIHAESIAWANAELHPPFRFFVCREIPPLEQPDQRFDLVYAMSVFTHITREWGRWLAELHRVIRPGGIAILSVLGRAMAQQILGRDWDERIGMAIVDLHKDWSIGGPSVLLSEWWVREHWGRAFEVIRFQGCDPADGAGHDLVVLRRLEGSVTPEALVGFNPTDPREQAAIECNLELVLRQQEALGEEIRNLQEGMLAAELRADAARSEAAEGERRLRSALAAAQRLADELDRLTRQPKLPGARHKRDARGPLGRMMVAVRSWRDR